ncbi:integrase, catalytic region, zinc finger, CCHC-type containing protein [Tanacetum coccineum]
MPGNGRQPKQLKTTRITGEDDDDATKLNKGFHFNADKLNWLEVTDERLINKKLEAHYSYIAKIQESNLESINDTYVLEKDDSNVIPDSSNICTNDNQVDQNAAECVDERVALANLIANLTLDTEENKTILKQLKKANASLTQELKECKTNLDESSRALGEATSSRDSSLIALQTKQTELEKYTALNDLTSDYKILQTKLNETLGLLARKDIDIKEDKTILDSHCFIHELKREMNDDLEYVNSLEKELDELESEKADFSNMYDLLLEECVSKDVICSYLHSLSELNAHTELQCMYLHKVKECECLAQKLSKQTESVNKEVHNKLLKSFAKLEKHSISLELSLQHCKEQMENNPVCKENASNVFRKEREQYHEIQDLKAQMQDKNMVINELKKLILVTKGKSVETQFDKPSVVRQPNAQRIPKPSVLGKPTPFSNSPEMRSFQTNKSVNKTNASDGLFKPVTQQNLPQKRNQAVRNTNVLKPGMFRIASTTTQTRTPQLPHASRNTNPHMSKSSGVIHTTSVSRPQLKCYQVKDKVVPNNSQVKFQKKEVEDHHRISSISKKTKSVTACNDSSNSRTSNVNAVCAECGKCVFNSNHDACVSRYLKDVNARTKKPNVVPISASKPKRKANKSVATPHKKTVASDTTIQKSKSYYKKLYEDTNQEWKWWIAKRCPSGYTWTQKPLRTKKIWMPKIRKDDVSSNISPTIDIIVQLILFIVDSGCTKHMTGNLKLLCNFVEKFLGTVRFGNDQFAPILGYGDLIQGNVTIKRVYYVEGLNHNLFSVGQFCDADLEVAFRKSTQDIYLFCESLFRETVLITGLSGYDLYTISLLRYNFIISNMFHGLKLHQLKHGLCIDRLSIRTSITSPLLSKKEVVTDTLGRFFTIQDETPEVLKGLSHDDSAQSSSQVITVRSDRASFLKDKKASDMDNSDPVPPRQNVVPSAEKPDSLQQGLEFLFSPLLEEYYNPTHGLAEENNNDQAPNASFQEDEFINPFLYTGTRNWNKFVEITPTNASFKQDRQLATDPEMCMFCDSRCSLWIAVRILVDHAAHKSFPIIRWTWNDENGISNGPMKDGGLVGSAGRVRCDPDHPEKVLPSQDKHLYVFKASFQEPDSGFELTAFSDADHAGCLDTRKSTSGGIQFLGDKLVSWMSKKQNCTAMTSAEAEYVALSAS